MVPVITAEADLRRVAGEYRDDKKSFVDTRDDERFVSLEVEVRRSGHETIVRAASGVVPGRRPPRYNPAE